MVSPTLFRSVWVRTANFVGILCLLVWLTAGGAACQVQLFGYFDNPIGNTGDRIAQVQQTARHANLTMTPQYWKPAEWDAAKTSGQQVVLIVPDELFWQIESGDVASSDLSMWCRDEGWCNRTFADWVSLVEQHRDQVAAILIADEKDCNDGVNRFPNWTTDSCRRAAEKILAIHQAVKNALPWAKTWVNYTSAWVYYFRLAQTQNRHPSVYGVSLPPADWISLDCYTPFSSCFGSNSVSVLYGALKPWLLPHQRFVLLPRAFMGAYLGWNPTPSQIDTMAGQYYAYAQSEPKVGAIIPFVWRNVSGVGYGAGSVPEIANTYTGIGQAITGRRHQPPTGLRVLQEPVPCVDGVVCPH